MSLCRKHNIPWSSTRSLKSIIRRIDARLFPKNDRFAELLQRCILPDCHSVLDVGCGDGALHERVPGIPFTVGIDLKLSDKARTAPYSEYRQVDVRSLADVFEPRQYDCAIAIDVIEHLTRDDGHRLLDAMEDIAVRRVIILTPNGFLSQPPAPDNPHQEHLSGWQAEDFFKRGYRVVGVRGWRPLRGMYAEIRWSPHFFWRRLSACTEAFTEKRPKLAFQLLCIKDTSAA